MAEPDIQPAAQAGRKNERKQGSPHRHMAAQPGKVDKSRNQDDPPMPVHPTRNPDDEANDDHHSHQHGRAPSFTGKRFPLSMTKPHRPLAIRHPFRNRRPLLIRTFRPSPALAGGTPLSRHGGAASPPAPDGTRKRHPAAPRSTPAQRDVAPAYTSRHGFPRCAPPQPPLHVRRHPAIQRGIGASEQVDTSPQKKGSGHAFFRILSVLGEGTHRTDSRNAEQDSEYGGHREQHAIPVVPCNGQRRKLRNGTGQQQLRPIGDEPLHDA